MKHYGFLNLFSFPVSLALIITAAASPFSTKNPSRQWNFEEISPSVSLVWHPCLKDYSCAMLDVPLDYSLPKGPRAAIPLIKIAAQKNSPNGTYKGMVLTNPGGPAELGVDFILKMGHSLLVPVIGTNYDIISFDPRGMGHSLPIANCSASSQLHRRAYGLSGPTLPQAYWDITFENAKEFGGACNAAIGGSNQAGPHMSTAVVARDMLSILEAFTATKDGCRAPKPSLLNYWGFSYGTFIGETYASIFPDRVGRFVLDGVVDPVDYISGAELSQQVQMDQAIGSFSAFCHKAGPALCPFDTGKSTADVKKRFENLFVPLNAKFAVEQNWENATTIIQALATMKGTIRANAYTPIIQFPAMAQQLVGFEAALKNLTVEGIEAASQLGVVNVDVAGIQQHLPEWQVAVVCSDLPSVFNRTYQDFEPYIAKLEKQSFVGGELWAGLSVICTGWSIKATSRYAGPFGGKTKSPILFVSNTVDPATPLVNSQKWSLKYKDSQVLTVEAVGHLSIAVNNSCANSKIGKYFQTGNLPGKNNHCPQEAGPFGVILESL